MERLRGRSDSVGLFMQTVIQIIFFLLSVLIIGSALKVVTSRNIIHAALWLIASFFCVGSLYMLMEAEFIAVVQVLVYVGAISILMLFAIMLTRHITGEREQQMYYRWKFGAIVSAALFVAVLAPTMFRHEWNITPAPLAEEPAAVALGKAFMNEYLLPFELAAVLLLVALIGAIVIAYEERSRRKRILTLAEEVALQRQSAGKEQGKDKGK